MSRSSFARFWLPPLLWAAIILAASSDLFSASHSGAFLSAALAFVLGEAPEPDVFAVIHFAARKCVHLIAYGILGALWFRALRHSVIPSTARDPEAQRRRPGRLGIPRGARDDTWRAFVLACVLATLVAALDETHQATLKSRTGTPKDVALDLAGAAIGVTLVRRFSAPAASGSPS